MNLQTQTEFETRNNIDEPITVIYKYGSRVYGCHNENSDYDYIAVVKSDNEDLYYSVDIASSNFTVYSEQKFIKLIKQHQISVLECIFQDENDMFVEHFKLDLAILRRAISSVSSNSYGKCGKKLKQGDTYIGLKSLFHSLRIPNFGIQIAMYGKIVNYSSANHFHKMIFDMNTDDWETINKRFKPIHNALKSHFKKLAPLEEEGGKDIV